MQLYLYFTPTDLKAVHAPTDNIYIVIDLIRATTTLTTIFERGAARVFAAETLEQAREAATQYPERLLCGERNAVTLPGFDYGNSPAQFSQLDLKERELILTTTNGSRAFYACPAQSIRLAGCLYNGQAVATQALKLAQQHNCDITIVCAAESDYFALDDATCAGYIALELQRMHPSIQSHDSVHAAAALYHSYPPPGLAEYCHSTQEISAMGMQDDVDFCMMQSKSSCVPTVTGQEQGTQLLILEPLPLH